MRSSWILGLLCFAFATSASAQADLLVTSSASQTQGLQLGQEILITTTVRNNGPNPSPAGSASISGVQQETYFFQFAGSETPGCVYDFPDLNPPTFFYMWQRPALAPGAEFTCVSRLRVVIVPDDNTAQLFADTNASGGVVDPVPGNNSVTLDFTFGFATTARHTIPAISHWGLALLAVGALALAWCASTRWRA